MFWNWLCTPDIPSTERCKPDYNVVFRIWNAFYLLLHFWLQSYQHWKLYRNRFGLVSFPIMWISYKTMYPNRAALFLTVYQLFVSIWLWIPEAGVLVGRSGGMVDSFLGPIPLCNFPRVASRIVFSLIVSDSSRDLKTSIQITIAYSFENYFQMCAKHRSSFGMCLAQEVGWFKIL